MHQDSFKFIKWAKDQFKPDKVVCLGDELDYHVLSFHDTELECPYSASQEFEEGKKFFSNLYDMFDEMDILESNHGSMVYRKAKSCGIPRSFMHTYKDVLEAPPGYHWHNSLILKASNGQDIEFHHGNISPKCPMRRSQLTGRSQVQGHHHNSFEVRWWFNGDKYVFGCTSGCLIDDDKYAFLYNKNNLARPMLGVTWIHEGIAYPIPMELDENKRWINA